jgi:hypothetical protein
MQRLASHAVFAGVADARELGADFSLVQALPHVHQTPWGASQSFQYSRFIRVDSTTG